MIQANLAIAPNGRVVIPATMRTALGCAAGGSVLARLVDGTLVLEPIDVAVRRAQAMVARYVPDGAGLVDELIAERHHAATDE